MGRRRKLETAVRRVDATRIRIENPQGVPITLFANADIPVDAGAVEQLLETHGDNARSGIWRRYDPREQEADLVRVHFGGSLPARETFGFADYVRGSGLVDGRDCHLGSVGGGNHFVEIQAVEDVFDGATAHAWGLKPDAVAIMAHSGSVGIGHAVGGWFDERARSIFPREVRQPAHGFYVIPAEGPHRALARAYLDAMRNAANFAFGNRLMLG